MVLDQVLELLLLLEHRSALLLVDITMPSPAVVAAILAISFAFRNRCIAHQPRDIISFFLVVPALVSCVVHAQETS